MDDKKEELTKEELQFTANMLAQASVRVIEAPKVLDLINKIQRIVNQSKGRQIIKEKK